MEILEQYKLIGKIQIEISKAHTISEALKIGLLIVQDECGVDCASAWLYDKETKLLRPIICVSSIDITDKTFHIGEGLIGKAYQLNRAVKTSDDISSKQNTEKLFAIEVESEFVVPLSNNSGTLGCVQFINKKGNTSMTNDTMDILDIMVSMIGLCIQSNEDIVIPWKNKDKIIHVENLVKDYTNGDGSIVKALKGISFDVYKGEFLVFLGESGSGKSTLLNIIGGIDNATDGSVFYKDFCVTKANLKQLTNYRKENIGFIFQNYNLMPNLNVKENIELISEMVSNRMDTMEALKLVGLEDKATKFPSQLSGGQQQRVSIARALAKKPNVIIADEPTAALDYKTSIEVLTVIEEIVKNGSTLVMVTHNEEIAKMADRIIKFKDGRLHRIIVNLNTKCAKDLEW